MTERLKKDIIKLVIDEVVIGGEKLKISATIPLPNKIHPVRDMAESKMVWSRTTQNHSILRVRVSKQKISNGVHEREIVKTDLPDTFNAGTTLGPINQTKMERIWTKHKQINPVRSKTPLASADCPKIVKMPKMSFPRTRESRR